MRTQSNYKRSRAFSLVELMTAVSLAGILATIGYFSVSDIAKSAKSEKLKSEVATLNSAVAAYLGFGGNLDALETADEIVKRLRSVSNSEMASRIPGLSSLMVDDRIGIRYQTKKEAATEDARVFWNAAKNKFELSTSGDGGIAAIYLKDAEDVEEVKEDDRQFAFVYAKTDSWVWDYNDKSAEVTTGPSAVATTDPSTIAISFPPSAAAATEPPEETSSATVAASSKSAPPVEAVTAEADEEPVEATTLAQPGFSIPGGGYPADEFDLQLVLSNPNPRDLPTFFTESTSVIGSPTHQVLLST